MVDLEFREEHTGVDILFLVGCPWLWMPDKGRDLQSRDESEKKREL